MSASNFNPAQTRTIKQIKDCLFYEENYQQDFSRFMSYTVAQNSKMSKDARRSPYEEEIKDEMGKWIKPYEEYVDERPSVCSPTLYGSILIKSDSFLAHRFILFFKNKVSEEISMIFDVNTDGKLLFQDDPLLFSEKMGTLIKTHPFACPGLFKILQLDEHELLKTIEQSRSQNDTGPSF